MPVTGQTKAARRPAFEHSGFFVIRTPLLPVEDFLRWSDGVALPLAEDDPAAQEVALASDLTMLRERLREAFDRPELREAVFIASPSLAESYRVWLAAPDSERGQRVERALVRYYSRMVTRCTPFGLFAGVSVGLVGNSSELLLEPREKYRRHARLDMYFLTELAQTLARDEQLRRQMVYRPNSSMYRVAGGLRYAAERTAFGSRSYQLVRIEPTDYLQALLERARDGAKLITLQALLIERDAEVTPEDADAYVNELVDSQVLVPDIEPTVTGPEPIHALVADLLMCEETRHAGAVLEGVRAAIDDLNAAPLGVSVERYHAIASALQTLSVKIDVGRLFQVDMAKPTLTATLGPAVMAEVVRSAEILQRFPVGDSTDKMATFRDAFVKRYEGREVPLVEVLDEEFGIDFGDGSSEASPLLAGIIFDGGTEDTVRKWTSRDSYLLEKFNSTRAGALELVLSDDDVERLGAPSYSVPHSMQFGFTLEAESQEALNEGAFTIHPRFLSGPTGVVMLGRFCHVDPILHGHVRRHIEHEEARRPEAVFAEIVHLPEGRLGNILHRPVLRGREIVYLGRSGAPHSDQIPISDLLVSVHEGRIVLRSAQLNREVIPRLTSAHNFGRGLPIYRFLAMLQSHGSVATFSFNWGNLAGLSFLPRVRAGRTVLSPAVWNLRRAELELLGVKGRLDSLRAFQKLRRDRFLPRHFQLVDGDNALLIDSDNALSVASFVDLVKRRTSARLVECYPSPDQLCVAGPEGRFFHEVVLPLMSPATSTAEGNNERPRSLPKTRVAGRSPLRSYAPGDEWIFFKLYCGTAALDQILCEVVSPLVKEVTQEQLAWRWFFIRYGDPDWHIRVRFNGPSQGLWSRIAPRLNELARPFIEDGRIWKVQLDTYDREIERYGGTEGMSLSEDIFHADSEAALAIVEAYRGDDGQDARWKLTLRGMDDLLDDLGLDDSAKRECLTRIVAGNRRMLKTGVASERSIGAKYRAERKPLEELFSRELPEDHVLAPGLQALARRSKALERITARLHELVARGGLTDGVPALCPSYLHMEANRLLRGAARQHELVLYDFLLRHYEARVARLKGKTAS